MIRGTVDFSVSAVHPCAWALLVLCLSGCSPGKRNAYHYQVAEPWELKGPFRAFAREGPPRDGGRESSKQDGDVAPVVSPSVGSNIPEEAAREPQPSDATPPGGIEPRVQTQESDPDGEAPSDPLDVTQPPTDIFQRLDQLDYIERPGLFSHGVQGDEDYWYLDMGFRLGQVRLDGTLDKLDQRLDPILALDPFELFEHPYTPRDRKTDWGMTTQYLGLGRRETDWFTWNFYLGYGFGGDLNHDRIAIMNIDVDFQYNFIYTGLTTDLYPWGKPKHANYPNWRECFYASRPYILTGFEMGYLRARGRGYISIAPFAKVYRDGQSIEDWLFSYLLGLGWELPIDDRWSFAASAHYTFHFYRPEEYNGTNITLALRYRF